METPDLTRQCICGAPRRQGSNMFACGSWRNDRGTLTQAPTCREAADLRKRGCLECEKHRATIVALENELRAVKTELAAIHAEREERTGINTPAPAHDFANAKPQTDSCTPVRPAITLKP